MAEEMSRVAAIGLGHWGRHLARNLHALGALAALYDSGAEVRARFGAEYPDCQMFDTLDGVLADPAISALAIATPAATHGEVVAMALDAGKHVFVEKPICLDVADAQALKARADAAGKVLMVGHLLLYHPAFRALSSSVRAGRLGRLRYIYSNRASLGKIRREENALWSFAPHDVSMILDLAGCMPRRVMASAGTYLSEGVADTTLSHLDFGDGVQAHVFVSWLHPYKEQRLVVVGDAAMAVFNDVADGADKLLLFPHRAEWDGGLPVISKADAEPMAYADGEPLRIECQAFLDAVAGRSTPPSDAAEGIRVLTVLDACQRAITGRSTVEL